MSTPLASLHSFMPKGDIRECDNTEWNNFFESLPFDDGQPIEVSVRDSQVGPMFVVPPKYVLAGYGPNVVPFCVDGSNRGPNVIYTTDGKKPLVEYALIVSNRKAARTIMKKNDTDLKNIWDVPIGTEVEVDMFEIPRKKKLMTETQCTATKTKKCTQAMSSFITVPQVQSRVTLVTTLDDDEPPLTRSQLNGFMSLYPRYEELKSIVTKLEKLSEMAVKVCKIARKWATKFEGTTVEDWIRFLDDWTKGSLPEPNIELIPQVETFVSKKDKKRAELTNRLNDIRADLASCDKSDDPLASCDKSDESPAKRIKHE